MAPKAVKLTPREEQILDGVVAEKTNKAIALDLGISEWTVKHLVINLYRKLDVNSRVGAAVWHTKESFYNEYGRGQY